MTRIRIVVAALAAAVFAAPAAFAQPADMHASTALAAAKAAKQDLRMPDRRAPAPPVSPAKDYSKNAASGDFAPAAVKPAPAPVAAADTGGDGIDTLPFVLFVSGALMLGGAAGTTIGSRRASARPAS